MRACAELPGSNQIQANLREWLAISEAVLGFSPGLVRSAFEAAIRLAPDVERIRRNLELFENAASETGDRLLEVGYAYGVHNPSDGAGGLFPCSGLTCE